MYDSATPDYGAYMQPSKCAKGFILLCRTESQYTKYLHHFCTGIGISAPLEMVNMCTYKYSYHQQWNCLFLP
jgi:hypothetical protein